MTTRLRRRLRGDFPDEFAKLYPSVGIGEAGNRACISLKGPIAAKIPPHWTVESDPSLLEPVEIQKLQAMQSLAEAELATLTITARIEFDAEARISKAGAYSSFH